MKNSQGSTESEEAVEAKISVPEESGTHRESRVTQISTPAVILTYPANTHMWVRKKHVILLPVNVNMM